MRTTDELNMMTLEELDLVTSPDQRLQGRYQHEMAVQVICPRTDQSPVCSDVYVGWTDDVSRTGARLHIPRSVTAASFWVRFPEAAPRDEFIECRVKWTDIPTEEAGGVVPIEAMFRCGVEFLQVLSREEFEQRLTEMRGVDE